MVSGVGVLLAIALAAVASPAPTALAQAPGRTRSVAFTFDDLPATRFATLSEGKAITEALLRHIAAHRIPAIGFVNENKLVAAPDEREDRSVLLEAWLDAGHELGNHTFSHVRLYDTPLEDFEAEVLEGERVTRRLLEARSERPRYFRHPTLNTGPDLETKAAFEAFLARHGYQVAPVTIDSDEYLYALAYERARARADRTAMTRLGSDYLRYMEETFAFYEGLSRELLGREPSQVLLLHANALNADYLDSLAARIAARGYRFVSLEQALQDPAYALRDDFVGRRGPSWLERWAITQGRNPGRPPAIPEWVRDATR